MLVEMQLSFQFADFFRDRRDDGGASPSGLRKPTFLVQTGVTGHLKIEDLKEDLLNDDQARIEVTLEGWSEPCVLGICAHSRQAS